MCRRNLTFKGLGLLVALALIAMGGLSVFAEEESVPEAGVQAKPVYMQEGCEPEGIHKQRAAVPAAWSAIKRKLHAAREAGDAEMVGMLEASLPKKPAEGEAAGETLIYPSTTVWGEGDFKEAQKGGFKGSTLTQGQKAAFGDDVHVRDKNLTTKEICQTLASDSAGNLYVAWEDTGIIQIYESSDGGQTWSAFAYLANPDAYLKEPCITVGEGYVDRLLVAYIADVNLGIPVPEVAASPLGTPSFTVSAVPIWSWWEGYAKPVIWTDCVDFPGWYAYLTCEGIYESATQNVNVCTWRSQDYAATWIDETCVLGDADEDAWIDPDGSYGTDEAKSFVACYNDTNDTLYTVISVDYGSTYPTQVAVHTMGTEPLYPVDPEIEAAVDNDNVMLCCTKYSILAGHHDNIGQIYSMDAGDTWSDLYNLNGYTSTHEKAPALTADRNGGCWHLAYTRSSEHRVMYSQRPQDLSDQWLFFPYEVDDEEHASATYSRKGIACDPNTGVCGIAWSDYRDGGSDYDTYFDSSKILRVPTKYSTIQSAIDAAADGYTVLVGPGIYYENIDYLGKAVTIRSTRGAVMTILDGNSAGPVVSFVNAEDGGSVIDGFTVTNGHGYKGGGIRCHTSSPYVTNCVVTGNYASYLGGGIYCSMSDTYATFSHLTISGNKAETMGGGMWFSYNQLPSPLVVSSIVWDNIPSEIETGASGILSVLCCDVKGGWSGSGSNNIDEDPLFANQKTGDFHLTWLSPCINRGATCTLGPFHDFENDIRPYMGKEDIGADEFTGVHSLEADPFTLPETTGGTVDFTLNGGMANANRKYIMLGGITGMSPGTPLPGGHATLPVIWDFFTGVVINLMNTPVFAEFMGTLDGVGSATAQLNLGPVPGAAGVNMYFAYALNAPWDFVSNPIMIKIE